MGRCGLCNRPLQDEQSIELGYGPACWARLSAAAAPPARGMTRETTESTVSVLPTPLTVSQTSPAGGATPATDRAQGPAFVPSTPPRQWSTSGPHVPAGSQDSPVLVALGWLVVLGALVALVEYWRWVVLGLAVLAVLAATGTLLEWAGERRRADATGAPTRSYRL